MPFDAVFMAHLITEIKSSVIGAKIDKIYQPANDIFVLGLRTMSGNKKLLLTCNPTRPRIHFTESSYENPAVPPVFCMLLRKHLAGGVIEAITVPPYERVADFSVRVYNELGDQVTMHLIVEIMGRNSNIVLTDDSGRIINSVRKVDFEMSQDRQVLPGLFYSFPPQQDKRNPQNVDIETISALLLQVTTPLRPTDFLLDNFLGISPLIARELSVQGLPETEDINELSSAQRYAFAAWLKNAFSMLTDDSRAVPTLLCRDKKTWDFTYMPISQYGSAVASTPFESYSSLLDSYYGQKESEQQLKNKSHSLVKLVSNQHSRINRKLVKQKTELLESQDRDIFRIKGELVTVNIHRIKRGDNKVLAENYYDPDCAIMDIALDPRLSPQENAAKYFKEYTKRKNAVSYLTEQIAQGEAEADYLDSILAALEIAESEKDLNEIRLELTDAGYLKAGGQGKGSGRKKKTAPKPAAPLEFCTSTGLRIRVGRNNRQNDILTLKSSYKSDVWFHTQKIHGSHVVLSCEGRQPDETSIQEAACLAAYYSHARESQNIPVDYTIIKNVKKPAGAKPGMVIYDHYNTIYVTPDSDMIRRLKTGISG